MKTTMPRPGLAVLASCLLACLPAHALFKVVGPDGKVTYSDRPPPAAEGRATTVGRDGNAAAPEAALPFALRQVVAKFPVTLYTASKCEPCDMGRALLVRRGIPFSERTATTPEDREAWEKMLGGPEAPVIRIGQQTMRGFNAAQWEETLDLAGYSRQSQLPANYKAAAAEPLAERKPVKPPVAAPEGPVVPAPVDTRSNPNAIRF